MPLYESEYNPEATQRLLEILNSPAATQHSVLIRINVLTSLLNGADPRATYPNGDSVITRAVRSADFLQQTSSISFGDRIAVVRDLLEHGALLTDEDTTTLLRLIGVEHTEMFREIPYETTRVKILAMLEAFSILEMDGGYKILQNMAEYAGVVRPSRHTEFGGKKKNRRTKQKKHNKKYRTRRR